jgi:hypothetical protein
MWEPRPLATLRAFTACNRDILYCNINFAPDLKQHVMHECVLPTGNAAPSIRNFGPHKSGEAAPGSPYIGTRRSGRSSEENNPHPPECDHGRHPIAWISHPGSCYNIILPEKPILYLFSYHLVAEWILKAHVLIRVLSFAKNNEFFIYSTTDSYFYAV